MAELRDIQLTIDQPSDAPSAGPPEPSLFITVTVSGTVDFTETETSTNEKFKLRIDLLPAYEGLPLLSDSTPLFTFSHGSRLFYFLRSHYFSITADSPSKSFTQSVRIDPDRLDSDPGTHSEWITRDVGGETTELEYEVDNDDPIVARVLLCKEARSNVVTVRDRERFPVV